MDLTILMPVFNERLTVESALEATAAADFGDAEVEIVVVDDGSTDGTRDVLAKWRRPPNVRVLAHAANRGKGAAIRTGLEVARGRYTTIMDADLEYDPQDIRSLLEPLLSGEAQVVYGVRGFRSHTAFNFWYVMGNKAVTLAANVLYNSYVSDIMTCFKVIPTDLMRSLELREDGFAIEPEMTARLLRRGLRIYEVPVNYRARSRNEGKKLTSLDGLRVLRTLVRCRVA